MRVHHKKRALTPEFQGGWGAAKSLSEAGVRVTLLDAAYDPTGASGMRTATGKPFEAGTVSFAGGK